MAKNGSIEKLKTFRRKNAERYAKALISPPRKCTMRQALPTKGVVILMGDRGEGKSVLGYKIAEEMHKWHDMPAVTHLPPRAPESLKRRLNKLTPGWIKVVTSISDWPKNSIVIYDEAAQTLHARRSQTAEAINIDNLVGISRQRHQLIIFISHYGRKLDLSTIAESNVIIWKRPTWAHALFERDELSDFTYKALNFFEGIKGKIASKRACLVMNFRSLEFFTFNNTLPTFWGEELSCIFDDLNGAS